MWCCACAVATSIGVRSRCVSSHSASARRDGAREGDAGRRGRLIGTARRDRAAGCEAGMRRRPRLRDRRRGDAQRRGAPCAASGRGTPSRKGMPTFSAAITAPVPSRTGTATEQRPSSISCSVYANPCSRTRADLAARSPSASVRVNGVSAGNRFPLSQASTNASSCPARSTRPIEAQNAGSRAPTVSVTAMTFRTGMRCTYTMSRPSSTDIERRLVHLRRRGRA